ncbi:NAD(P)/FAD-dependent oxidoreductase [Rathayibacter toxicus]|uniref:Pyridine nucleotide-disulfide oxidoreductase domain-containing protein 2 n=1 Tax=Rathayibacter toxicus TaxID=145458 RepID=A0A0C5BCY1_9MICO|nr:NAD(P)/FAD-dependent oxidoreductase [Rathayibacter toxicus]AJM77016.1 dehydrogenase [Rathayibacter toxicus]ALS57180.1 dehydrogenase [Rathayibacter toxicus]KKM46016.1 dehydrogenase [Rathayibacter toxicus]PPG22945.1 NAD(P)/FAD-dependent oxidoreductase [Rathayibacter toxicus]PPG47526.1 NAD(P)/FAD-dependent oxidoreductase [Rathayibacter toxicus]
MTVVDAIVIGAGPNGLAAAVTLARAGLSVTVMERNETIGGGARTAELTLPGFRHDVCSAVHPTALASGFFRAFGLEHKIDLRVPEISYGHPLDGGRAGIAYHDIERTVGLLGRDGAAWRSLLGPLTERADRVAQFTNNTLVRFPTDLGILLRFGIRVLEQGSLTWNLRFRDDLAPAMLAGIAAHSIRPLPSLSTAAAALALGAYAHGRGWPVPIGGSQAIITALADDVRAHGGTIETGVEVTSLAQLPSARVTLFDLTPRAVRQLAGKLLPAAYARALGRFRYGNGVAKVDFALDGPVPWTHPELAAAGTVHLGGTRAEITAAERDVAHGRHSENPYVLLAQPSVIDPSRAPDGKHVLWAYTHVPRYSPLHQREAITTQIERFAPGFRDRILATSSMTARDIEEYNPNYLGGDIGAGAASLVQLLSRPVLSADPWRMPVKGFYLCSSSTPPGPGVHGMAGWHAARSALRHEFGNRSSPALSP